MSLRLLAAFVGGVAYFLGYLGFGLWPLLFVFLIPLWWALDVRHGAEPMWVPALLGLVFGATAHAGGFAWLWRLVDAFLEGGVAAGALWWGLHGLWFALGFAAHAAVYAWLRRRGVGVALAGPPGLVLLEWLWPQLFPAHAGAGLVRAPWLAQAADLGGPLLLTGLLAASNAALYAAWSGRRSALAAWALGLGAVAAYGAVREAQLDGSAAGDAVLRIGIVQANLDPRDKAHAAAAGHAVHLTESEALLAESEAPPDLIVWPETAYVPGVRRPLPVDATLIRGPVLSRARVPLLFGTSSSGTGEDARAIANSVLLAGPDGLVESAYDKNILIPLAEYVPLAALAPALREWFPHAQRYRASGRTPALRLGDLRIATPICYEVAHADFVARMVRSARPQLLVTVANDAWFGDSAEPWIHLDLARLRAIEQRLPVVRATNSGISAFIDPTGRITGRSGLLERARLLGSVAVPAEPAPSPYTRAGDWPGPLAAALLGVAVWRGRAPRTVLPPPPERR